jgi:hypothetical protein
MIQIGGDGIDKLIVGSGDGVLIGGSTNPDADEAALHAALMGWGANPSYSIRSVAIDALFDDLDDGDKDTLKSASGCDLFFSGLGEALVDVKLNGSNAEMVL